MRAVLDANQYVSALWNPHGVPAQVVAAYRAGRFTLLASPALLAEVEAVLRRAKFSPRFTEARIAELLDLLRSGAEWVTVGGTLQLCRDPKDDMMIETAVGGRADVIVSGDKDLTDAAEVKAYLAEHGVQVVSARTFVRLLQLLPSTPAAQPPRGGDSPP